MNKLLFIPGILGDDSLWQPIIEKFPRGYIHKFIDINNGSTLEELAQMLWSQVTGEAVLIGFSFGAWIALQAYALFPKRCQGLILISSAPGNLTQETRERFLGYIKQIAEGNFEEFIKDDYEQDVAAINKNNLQIKNSLMNMMKKQGPDIAIKQFNIMLQFKGDFSNLNNIHCPTLLLRGAFDESINIKRQEQISQEIHQADLKIIPDAAHYVPLENPAGTLETIQTWLKNHDI